MSEANERGTPKLRPAVSWETDGGLFYKLSFRPVPIARLEVIPILPSPSPCTLGVCSRVFVHSAEGAEDTGWCHKHICTAVSSVFLP